MKLRFLLTLLVFLNPGSSSAESLCRPPERVVFSCIAKEKIVSLCASGDLTSTSGRMMYRFGRSIDQVELDFGAGSSPARNFSFDYQPWSKGESLTVSFKRGKYVYLVNHSHGVYGVDGGSNGAAVNVMRGDDAVATISCNESSVIDRMYSELKHIGLPQAFKY